MTSFTQTVKHSHLLGSFRPNKPPAVSHCLIGNVTSYGRTIDVAIYSIATDLVSFSCFMCHRLQRRIWPLSCGLLYAERWHLYLFFFFSSDFHIRSRQMVNDYLLWCLIPRKMFSAYSLLWDFLFPMKSIIFFTISDRGTFECFCTYWTHKISRFNFHYYCYLCKMRSWPSSKHQRK